MELCDRLLWLKAIAQKRSNTFVTRSPPINPHGVVAWDAALQVDILSGKESFQEQDLRWDATLLPLAFGDHWLVT